MFQENYSSIKQKLLPQTVKKAMPNNNEKKEDEEKPLLRTNTMDRTVEEGNIFLEDFDPSLRKRKRDEQERLSRSPNKRIKRSKSPKKRTTRSISPKKKQATPKKEAKKVTPKKTRSISPNKVTQPRTLRKSPRRSVSPKQEKKIPNEPFTESQHNYFYLPTVECPKTIYPQRHRCTKLIPEWEFQMESSSFALAVNNGKVWCGNDNGDVFGFTLDGDMKSRMKLPSGVKCLVADMGHWLYAGCDDGIVYDLSREEAPRIAYEIDSAVSIENYLEIEQEGIGKKRNILFVLDRSSSMSGPRIQAALTNIQMIYNSHLKNDDKISLIEFDTHARTRFLHFSKENASQKAQMEKFHFSDNASLLCQGRTALWDAMEIAYKNCDADRTVENWVIVLTDGKDNESKKATFDSILNSTKEKKENVNLIMIGIGLKSNSLEQIKQICSIHPRDFPIVVRRSDVNGIANAFKLVASVLSSKIIGMDIRDGLIAVSDNRGNLSACDIEGNQNWSNKSPGVCGWMIKADFEGIYHGHTNGVTCYSPVDGSLLWNSNLTYRILSGFLDRRDHILFLSSGPDIRMINAKDGKQIGFAPGLSSVVSNTYDFDQRRIFAVDKRGNLHCLQYDAEKQHVKLVFVAPSELPILSIYYCDNKILATTSDGKLVCFDVSESSIAELKKESSKLPFHRAQTKKIQKIEAFGAIAPVSILPVISEDKLTNEVVVECYQEYSDLQVAEIANSLHDISISEIQIEGVNYPVQLNNESSRFVKVKGLVFAQQDQEKQTNFNIVAEEASKYVEMAKNGTKVTWIINGEKEWGLILDDKVVTNGTRLLIRPVPNDKGFDTNKIVQFPRSVRNLHARYAVQSLLLSENGAYYRSFGEICRIEKDEPIKI